jgi:hypothetical protein
MISTVEKNNYGGLTTEIVAASNRRMAPPTCDAILKFLEGVGWHRAKMYAAELVAMTSVPTNVYGWLQTRHAAELAAFAAAPTRDKAPSHDVQAPPAPRKWVARYTVVITVIQRYFGGHMASRDADDKLLLAPIEGDCPQGWYPVNAHFCVGKHLRDVTYCREGKRIVAYYRYDPEPHDPVWVRVSGMSEEAEYRYIDNYAIALNDYRVKHMTPRALVAGPALPRNMAATGDVMAITTEAERIADEITTLMGSLDTERQSATLKYIAANRDDVNKLKAMLGRIKAVVVCA